MFDPLLTGMILGGIEQASQNAIKRQNNQAQMYGNGSARLDSIQSQQDIQKRIQQIHMKNMSKEKTGFDDISKINDLIAKYALCCYVTRIDGCISENEKNILDSIYSDILNRCKTEKVKKELSAIANMQHMDFIVLEKYLNNASPQAIVSYLSIIEEIVNTGKRASDAENQCIFKVRKYLTDRTGTNYITNTIQTDKNMDSKCPGCAATMEFVPYSHRFECPYCGNTKYI